MTEEFVVGLRLGPKFFPLLLLHPSELQIKPIPILSSQLGEKLSGITKVKLR